MFSAILKTAFTGKFPSSTAGLHFVMSISCLRKKSRLVRYRMVECFHLITIDAKHLYFRCEQLLFFLREINRFLETLSSFCIFEKALFLETRDSILETRDSILETRSSNVSSIEARGNKSRNKSFSRNPFEFLHIRESLVSRDSRLDPRTFRASRLEDRVSSLEFRVSTYF